MNRHPLVRIFALAALAPALAACADPRPRYELGGPFTAAGAAPGKARIYVYWPATSRTLAGDYRVFAQDSTGLPNTLLHGGYVARDVPPGALRVEVDRTWQLGGGPVAPEVYSHGPPLVRGVAADEVYYLRARPREGAVDRIELEEVPAATALPEIQLCRLPRKMGAR